ncbi:DNA-processing protein DprA [Georgenia satyanarayanai]|uniref:DNA-processing protein DprA n=1 Tax=Georgenia satyanarayanai TaxID=860221 RepID=UPI001264B2AF|nr:DNA-processing protein DprA [Georgenia satyanarayanai]
MPEPPFDLTDTRLAAAAWTRVAEPGDRVAGVLRVRLGPGPALEWLWHVRRRSSTPVPPGGVRAEDAVTAADWQKAVDRWGPRLKNLDIRRELGMLDAVGGRLLLPGDDEWPATLADLGERAPAALWVRGNGRLDGARPAAAIVGMRASTRYGETIAAQLAIELAGRGVVVVSGGAYGIDAAAHRGALSANGLTWAVLAGGVDRLYPAGNTRLLEAVMDEGVVLAEPAPGSSPGRHRFLERNRLIAALGRVCVVVEAGWRSGALSTARHAEELLRPVAAVPGPVTSMASAGCHRLLRDRGAVCVTDAADVLELLAPSGEDLAPDRVVQPGLLDGLDPLGARVLDALPVRSGATLASLARAAGLSEREVRAGVGRLELSGHAERSGSGWRRTVRPM